MLQPANIDSFNVVVSILDLIQLDNYKHNWPL